MLKDITYIFAGACCAIAFGAGYWADNIQMLWLTCGAGAALVTIIYLSFLFYKLIVKLYRIIKNIFLQHKERNLWWVLLAFLLLMLFPIIKDIYISVVRGAIHRHWFLFGVSICGLIWAVCIIGNKTLNLYKKYKAMIIVNSISTFDETSDYQNFSDFILASINVKAHSLIWIRKFIILFCIPLLIGGYAIGMMKQWQNIYNALSLASIGIAMFSVWYTINWRHANPNDSNAKEADFMDITAIKDKQKNTDNEWHENE